MIKVFNVMSILKNIRILKLSDLDDKPAAYYVY